MCQALDFGSLYLPSSDMAWRLMAEGATVSSSVIQYKRRPYPSHFSSAFRHRLHSGLFASHFTFLARHVQQLEDLIMSAREEGL